ncbi:class I SAM-dependent methyltransferase [Sulfuriferula thiophila]|uniref:class I SAM-dependent methyltransferase n=1 Tax=Sulfuriferula thiophila TaxID=1781211 RepID=UPI000F60BD6E|nr:class I SAM-dependent methyltransferase [Sulfuriferula thiophila]
MQPNNFAKHAQSEQSILVFPVTHPDGRAYFEDARERDEHVIAASSVWDDEFSKDTQRFALLPYVYEPTFPALFLDLLNKHNITRVYAPVASVYSWLAQFIAEHKIAIQLIGESPIQREMKRFDKLMDKVAHFRGFIDVCAGDTCDLSDLEIAAVFRMASNIYGESNEDKIAAMMAIFATVPKGDVVEIGSLVGKSAAVLTLLARRYGVGNVLAIDPWQAEAAMQHDSPDIVRVGLANEWKYEVPPQDFVINLLPVGLGNLNYLRQESIKGCEFYKDNRTVISPAFGRVEYQGKIGIIHIDGNHDYAQVKQDCELWMPLLVTNGWLILDDYIWVHGDGPRRIGDALLEQRAQAIERAFVCGKALFIKFNGL